MITLTDIKKAITSLLKTNFSVPVISQDIEKGFARPSMTVYFDDVKIEQLESQIETFLLVQIYYFSKLDDEDASIDILEKQQSLPMLFGNNLKVKDRAIHITEPSSNLVDGILVFEFNLSFEQGTEIEDTPLIQTLFYESE